MNSKLIIILIAVTFLAVLTLTVVNQFRYPSWTETEVTEEWEIDDGINVELGDYQ